MAFDPSQLPADLPVPVDDGTAAHLPGTRMPALALPSTSNGPVRVDTVPEGFTRRIIYAYPMTGLPGVPVPDGWDEIPGARGCTPESCGFRDHFADLRAAGAAGVYGLSSQDTDYQREVAERLNLPFALLSDTGLRLGQALTLPTFEVEGQTLYKRLTLIARDGAIEHVFYPIFPPTTHAQEVLDWLRAHPR
jgi:peroxiredoxin